MNEIEVKISFGDYRREFKKAKYEDWRRAALEENRGQSCADKLDPNYMFFAAPEDLAHKIIADPECSKYGHGILVVKKRMHTFYSIQAGQYSKEIVEVEVLKRARKIHAHPVGEKTLQSIVSRLTSELITMREQVRQ